MSDSLSSKSPDAYARLAQVAAELKDGSEIPRITVRELLG